MKRSLWRIGVVTLVLLGAGMPQPSQAANATGGSIAFAGEASLPTFPCAPPSPGQQPCLGTFGGTITGSLSGVHRNAAGLDVPWSIAVATSVPAACDATGRCPIRFSYADGIEPGVRCMEGTAQAEGTIYADQLRGEVNGVYGRVETTPLGLPRSVVAAKVDFKFNWYRVGTTANLEFDRLKVVLTVFGSPNTEQTVIDTTTPAPIGTVGYGAAGFSPAPPSDPNLVAAWAKSIADACDGLTGPIRLDALVVGNADFAVSA